jgi:glutathione synthase/RimK-type ligase-like ATP-grasp enzyme
MSSTSARPWARNETELITQNRIPLNVLLGVPDHGSDLVRVSRDGKQLQLLGGSQIMPYLSPKRFALHRFYLQKGVRVHLKLSPGAILNQIADCDLCPGALEMADRLVSQLSTPCFNAPGAIARTSRDQVARVLSGIAGLRVPKTIRIDGAAPTRIREAIEREMLEYPVLLRPIGSHGGESLIRIDKPKDLDDMSPIRGSEFGLYATEFHDFVGADGRYRKFRVVVLGEQVFLRHCIIADNWLLHAARRAAGTENIERQMFAIFDRECAAQLHPIFREIGSRLKLDFFGIDCNIDDHGRVVLFEANAAMNILQNTSPSPNMWDAPIARIKGALEDRLASPSTWYGASGRS